MSSTAPFNQRSFPSLDCAESVDPWPMWPLVGSFVLHIAMYVAFMDLRFLPEVEPTESSYHVSLVTLPALSASAPPMTNARPQDPVELHRLPPVSDIEPLLHMPKPSVGPVAASGQQETPVHHPEEADRMAELLTQTIQSVHVPEIKKPQPANRASGSVPRVPERVLSNTDISVRDLTAPIVPPEPPPLATVHIEEEPTPLPPFPLIASKSKRDSREPAIANLAIPELVSVLTVRRPDSIPTASETQDGPTAPHEAESSSTETSYWEQIRSRIHQRWFVSGMHHLDLLQVVLAFRVERTGRMNRLIVHRSSGNKEYDLTAQRAVVSAGPFPSFPPAITEDYRDVNFRFSFQLVQ